MILFILIFSLLFSTLWAAPLPYLSVAHIHRPQRRSPVLDVLNDILGHSSLPRRDHETIRDAAMFGNSAQKDSIQYMQSLQQSGNRNHAELFTAWKEVHEELPEAMKGVSTDGLSLADDKISLLMKYAPKHPEAYRAISVAVAKDSESPAKLTKEANPAALEARRLFGSVLGVKRAKSSLSKVEKAMVGAQRTGKVIQAVKEKGVARADGTDSQEVLVEAIGGNAAAKAGLEIGLARDKIYENFHAFVKKKAIKASAPAKAYAKLSDVEVAKLMTAIANVKHGKATDEEINLVIQHKGTIKGITTLLDRAAAATSQDGKPTKAALKVREALHKALLSEAVASILKQSGSTRHARLVLDSSKEDLGDILKEESHNPEFEIPDSVAQENPPAPLSSNSWRIMGRYKPGKGLQFGSKVPMGKGEKVLIGTGLGAMIVVSAGGGTYDALCHNGC